jgi:hypothetical protein
MIKQQIVPEKVSKPIQLLAAWLLCLVTIDCAFLSTATKIAFPLWVPSILVIASIANVPVFLLLIFFLQTKFRSELLEDKYYSELLKNKDSGKPYRKYRVIPQKNITNQIIDLLGPAGEIYRKSIQSVIFTSQIQHLANLVGQNRTLSELYLRSTQWETTYKKWKNSPSLNYDLNTLEREDLITVTEQDYSSIVLTTLGNCVAQEAEKRGVLFAQQNENFDYWGKEKN